MRRGKGKPRTGARSARKDSALAPQSVYRSATTCGRSIGVPASADQASRTSCACVHASGVARTSLPPARSPFLPVGARPSQTCSGSIPPPLAGLGHGLQQRARRAAREQLVLAALAGEDRPRAPERPARVVVEQPPRTAVAPLAVAVEGVAVPEVAGLQARVDDPERVEDHRVVRALDAEPDELEEARVDDAALVDVGRARSRRSRTWSPRSGSRSLRQAQVVRASGVRPVRGRRPALDVAGPRVGLA